LHDVVLVVADGAATADLDIDHIVVVVMMLLYDRLN
jgi:hypothetical protein